MQENYLNEIKAELHNRQAKNPYYSLRAFSRDSGISPSHLSVILRNKQTLSVRLGRLAAQKLGLKEIKLKENQLPHHLYTIVQSPQQLQDFFQRFSDHVDFKNSENDLRFCNEQDAASYLIRIEIQGLV